MNRHFRFKRLHLVVAVLTCLPVALTAQATARAPAARRVVPLPRDTNVAAKLPGSLHIIQAGRVVATVQPNVAVPYKPGQFIARKTGDSVHVEIRKGSVGMVGEARPETVTVLPYTYEGRATDNHPVRLRPAVFTEALRYEAVAGQFHGTLLIALEDENLADENRQLSGPIPITIASLGDDVNPSDLNVVHTNLPAVRVAVLARNPLDSVKLQVIPNFDLRGVPVWLPVKPTLVIPNGRSSAPGLGVSTTPLNIAIRGKNLHDSVRVLLTTNLGSLDEQQVVIPPGGSARVGLRSEGVGTATVTATAPGVDAAETTITFTWPIVFVLMAIMGGAVGGFTATVVRKHRSRSAIRPMLVGALIGFFVAIVYRALNLNLTGFNVPVLSSDEAAVFAFALLGGAFGIPALGQVGGGKRDVPKAKNADD